MIERMIEICFILVMFCYMAVSVLHILHMFQQNRYELGRLNNWIKEQGKRKKIPFQRILISIGAVLLLLIGNETLRLIAVFWFAIAISFIEALQENKRRKKYIKPLHLTARVQRQIVVMVVLNCCWLVLWTVAVPSLWWCLALVLGMWINWGLVYLMAWITEPIENLVKKHYMNLAKKILKNHNAKIVGITGSYGKTSCKNILQAILSERFYSLMTPASFNTPMGITITIRNHLKPLHEVFICEMGADHVGDIEFLMDFVGPKYGIVTSIGPQHLQTFKSQENIIHEKMQMIEKLPVDGVGVLNKDNEWIRGYTIANSCKVVWYGIEQEDVDYRAVDIRYSKHGSVFTVVDREGNRNVFETRLLGEHNIANILAAIALGREMGVTYSELQDAVAKVQYVEHRLQLKKMNGLTFIDNAFNSNPVGAAMSLEVMKMMDGKRFIVTPGMIDLGAKQEEMNKAFGSKMKGCVDEVILVGEAQTKPIVEGLKESGFDMNHVQVVKTVKEAFNILWKTATVQDTILLENDLPDAFNQ